MGVGRPNKGIGFSPEALRDGLVFHGVLTCSLKFNPQALDEGQTLASVIGSGTGKHARGVLVEMTKLKSRSLDYAPSSRFNNEERGAQWEGPPALRINQRPERARRIAGHSLATRGARCKAGLRLGLNLTRTYHGRLRRSLSRTQQKGNLPATVRLARSVVSGGPLAAALDDDPCSLEGSLAGPFERDPGDGVKSLEDRLKILQHCSPTKLEAISILVNEALKDEWRDIGSSRTGVPGAPYQWKCDEPGVLKKGDRR